MKENLEKESVRIKPSTKRQLEREASELGISKSELERMKLESPLKPHRLQKKEVCIEKVQRIEMKNQIRDYIKKHGCDDELAMLFQTILNS